MNWIPSYGDIMALAFVLAMLLWLRELAANSKIKGVLRAGLRRARNGGRDNVRIDQNQVAELLGEELEAGWQNFSSKFDAVHPAMRAPARRRKLRRGA